MILLENEKYNTTELLDQKVLVAKFKFITVICSIMIQLFTVSLIGFHTNDLLFFLVIILDIGLNPFN